MSSNQKRGFRLPWAADHGSDQDAAAATLDPDSHDGANGADSDELGEGPFRLAGTKRTPSTDSAPADSDVPDQTPEAAMIETGAHTTESSAAPPSADAESPGGWPQSDRRSAMADRPAIRVEGESRMPRRDNPLVAGLVKAMREAAIASRAETTARLEAEATARVEAIRARATTEATDLRKRADEDVSAIREWSKAEIARLRQETDDKIEQRKVELAGETERHAAGVDRLVDEVQTTVSSFEADMDEFFNRLLAENDPARLATLAEQAPDPPDLRGEGPTALDFVDEAPMPEAQAEAEVEHAETEAQAEASMDAPAMLEAGAAAEAEAEATEGLDPLGIESWPTAVLAAAHRGDAVQSPAEPNGPDATRLLVSGLTSVAGISAFKGALGQLAGVRSVSVSSGEPGVFVFAVTHDPGVDLDSGLSSLTGFAARVTDATDDGFTVVADEAA